MKKNSPVGFRGLSLQIGRPFGIDLILHAMFLGFWGALLAVVCVTDGALSAVVILGFLTAVYTSVTLHELGHCLVARKLGYETQRITLFPFGGVALINMIGIKPKEELLIALAGPAVNLVILMIAIPLSYVVPVPGIIILVNAVMLIFNLIPAFPLDGGRVLRSVLALRRQGDMISATKDAVIVGKVVAVGFAVLAIVTFDFWLIVIAAFVWYAGGAEQTQLINNHRVDEITKLRKELDDIYAIQDHVLNNDPPKTSAALNSFVSHVDGRIANVIKRLKAIDGI